MQRRVNPVDNGNNTLFRGAATVLDLSHLLSMSTLGRLGPLSMYTDGPSEMMSYWTEQCKLLMTVIEVKKHELGTREDHLLLLGDSILIFSMQTQTF